MSKKLLIVLAIVVALLTGSLVYRQMALMQSMSKTAMMPSTPTTNKPVIPVKAGPAAEDGKVNMSVEVVSPGKKPTTGNNVKTEVTVKPAPKQ